MAAGPPRTISTTSLVESTSSEASVLQFVRGWKNGRARLPKVTMTDFYTYSGYEVWGRGVNSVAITARRKRTGGM